jgi:hypothetical protein
MDPLRRNYQTGELERINDYRDALRFTDVITFILSSNAKPNNKDAIKKLEEVMADFTEDDYFLCVGNPIFLFTAGVYLPPDVNRIKFLQWSNGSYMVIEHTL